MNKGLYTCVSRKIIEGEPIRVAYKESSKGPGDSGWRLLSGSEDELYAVNPDNTYMIKIKEVLEKFPELESVFRAKRGSLFEADENGDLVLSCVDKKLKHVAVKIYFKPIFVTTVGTRIFITADVNDMKTFTKKKREW